MPGKLVRAGCSPSGRTKIALRPGACGTIVIVSSVPAATGFKLNAVTAAGAGPGDGAVVLKTNGSEYRPTGTLSGGASVARYQPVSYTHLTLPTNREV